MIAIGGNMRIKLNIDKQIEDTYIAICSKALTLEVKKLYQTIDLAVNATIQARDGDEIRVISCYDIIHIYTQDLKVYVATLDGVYRLNERLYELEEKLDQTIFIRISNSEIINIKKIKRLDTSLAGTIRIYLDGDREAYVSRRYLVKIKKALGL